MTAALALSYSPLTRPVLALEVAGSAIGLKAAGDIAYTITAPLNMRLRPSIRTPSSSLVDSVRRGGVPRSLLLHAVGRDRSAMGHGRAPTTKSRTIFDVASAALALNDGENLTTSWRESSVESNSPDFSKAAPGG